jgi:hypothetical protein
MQDANRVFHNGFLAYPRQMGIIDDKGGTPAGGTDITVPDNMEKKADETEPT